MSIANSTRALFAMACIGAVVAATQTSRAQNAAPVIYSVTLRKDIGRYEVVYPEFHFQDASGTVQFIHRELVSTNAPKTLHLKDSVVSISPEQQKQGATYAGKWKCGPETYYATLRAYMLNISGQKSNAVEYTIHCNGG